MSKKCSILLDGYNRWFATPGQIKNNKQWCPYCSNNVKNTIEKMQQIAKSRGGKCLSDIYVNNKTKLLWQCGEGHLWEARPNDIISSNSWCPKCRKRKI